MFIFFKPAIFSFTETLNEMKKIYVLVLLCVCSSMVFAQQKVIFHYKFIHNLKGRTGGGLLDQFYQNGQSLEMPKTDQVFKGDTINEGPNKTKVYLNGDNKRLPFILKTPASKSLIYAERIWIKPTVMVVDTFNNFKWRISKETKNIGDVNCTKAETYFRGRNYVAWFKKDNNFRTGPWKFGGLPGIIYEVSDAEGVFNYVLESLEFVDKFPVELKLPEAYKDDLMITHSDFINKWKTIKEEAEKNNDKVGHTFTGSTRQINFVAPLQELY
ncbi:GLPGLI family protein [Pedobacter soli]|uniref:GLPGLI family protein n=2 Tax=Pedobacter soli TaxID=390242 RepID=A0A1G7D140_9SPHI|nr:GLPGLI family protein [Pedobacter soli]